jgi:hypothetical protein
MKNYLTLILACCYFASMAGPVKGHRPINQSIPGYRGAHPAMTLLTTEQLGYRKKQSTFYDYLNGWIEDSVQDFTYTLGNRPSGTLIYPYDSATQATNLQYREFYQYDQNGNILSHRLEQLKKSVWQLTDLDTVAYDAKGLNILEAEYSWDSIKSKMIPLGGFRSTYTYDSNGVISNLIVESLSASGKWSDESKFQSTLDSSGNINGLTGYFWNGLKWISSFRTIQSRYLNNDINKPLQETTQIYQNGGYINYEMDAMTYDSKNRPATEFFKHFVKGAWKDSLRENISYDPNDILKSYINEKWNGNTWDTAMGERNDITYDANNSPAVRIMSDFDPDLKKWVYTQKEVSEFESYETRIHSAIQSSGLFVFPSPAEDHLVVSFENASTGESVIRILDLNGRIMQSDKLTGKGEAELQIGQLKPGIYILQIQIADQMLTQRFVKQ